VATYTLKQLYDQAKSVGFGSVEAAIMASTAWVESTGRTNPPGNLSHHGILQFSDTTWQETGQTCSAYDPICAFKGAKSLIDKNKKKGVGFLQTVHDTWTKWETPGAVNQPFKQLGGGIDSSGNPINDLSGWMQDQNAKLPILGQHGGPGGTVGVGGTKQAAAAVATTAESIGNAFGWMGDTAGYLKDHPAEAAIGLVALIVLIGAAKGMWADEGSPGKGVAKMGARAALL
jgi:hypothetical protein